MFAEPTAAALAEKLHAAHRVIAERWLNEITQVVPLDEKDVFPGLKLLDHIPEIVQAIAAFLKEPDENAITANTAVMEKARQLGELRFEQRATVHQLLREYDLLGTLLERFLIEEVERMDGAADPVGALLALARIGRSVRVFQQQTVDTFVTRYSTTIERQNAQLRDFTKLVSHEIRQPLGVLQMVARMLPMPNANTAQLTPMLQRNVDRLTDVTGSLERLVRSTHSGEAPPALQELDLSSVAVDVAKQLADMALGKGVQITVDADLPRIVADPGRVELALINLVANAIKYSDPAKAAQEVKIARGDGCCSVRVEDNGIGIPQERLQSIFDQFVRVHAERDSELRVHGLGLGLSIVRESMDVTGGHVTVTSEEGVGSVFTLVWPDTAAAPAADAQ